MSWGTSGPVSQEGVENARKQLDERFKNSESEADALASTDALACLSAVEALVANGVDKGSFAMSGHRNEDGTGSLTFSVTY